MSKLAHSTSAALDHGELSPKNFQRVADFVKAYSGIKMPSGKRTMLEGRLRRRARVLGIEDVNTYCRFLFDEDGLDQEAVHLIYAVTTNKTEFFREPAHFEFIATTAAPKLIEAGRRRIRSWSAAASTGAEAYTLAMVLHEICGRSRAADFSILATDVCTEVLAQAHAGRFPASMIEPISPERRMKYLMRAKDPGCSEVRIVPSLRSKVSFGRLNLMDETYAVDSEFDLIFCRNVLIYFDKPTQKKVVERLIRHLAADGYLFLGHSECTIGADLPLRQVASTVFQKV